MGWEESQPFWQDFNDQTQGWPSTPTPHPPGTLQLEAWSLALNLSWKAIHLGQVPPRPTYGQVATVCAAEKIWLKLAGYLNHHLFVPSKCYQLFRKLFERTKQIQPKLPSLSVCPGLFSHEENETSRAGTEEALHKLVFSTPPHSTLLSTTLKKSPPGIRSLSSLSPPLWFCSM